MKVFADKVEFDGGFTANALVKDDWELEDFKSAWSPKTQHTLRKIRNALVHAREARMSEVIAPTRANQARLRPWTNLVSIMAQQVILYWDV
jgi:hypothetical protein